jgi:hypothetical protein
MQARCWANWGFLALVAAIIAGMGVVGSQATAANLTWDGNTGSGGLQDGGGTWDTSAPDRWYNGVSYETWVNSPGNGATFGVGIGAAGTVTLGTSNTAISSGMVFDVQSIGSAGGILSGTGALMNSGSFTVTGRRVATVAGALRDRCAKITLSSVRVRRCRLGA